MTMFEKLNFMKPLVIGGAAAAAIAVMPVAAAEASVGSPASAGPTHSVYKQDPGGGGCDSNGNCGSGGQFNGPGGGPGGQGCSRVSAVAPAGSSRAQVAYPAVPDVFRASAAAPATAKPPE